MNDMHEAVALPDPAVKRLLHPTDLPEARELYRRGWWFGRLGSVPVAVAIAAVVWAIGGSLLGTIAAAVSTFVIGFAASRWFTSRAWDFIPRKRRDEEGAPAWRLLAAAIDAAALLVTAAAVILAIGNRPVADGVIAFAAGSGIGVAVIQA